MRGLKQLAYYKPTNFLLLDGILVEDDMNKKDTGVRSQAKPLLIKSRAEVSENLLDRIEIGRAMLAKSINSQVDFDNLCQEKDKWHRFNITFLEHTFDRDEIGVEYKNASVVNLRLNPTFSEQVIILREYIEALINVLASIEERLPLYAQVSGINSSSAKLAVSNSKDVFIVHGHDEALKHEVARLVDSLGLNPIILSEQPSQGATVISKFKKHATDAAFAIVLLTPDDVGHPKNNPELSKPRARQNAILELGYFIRALEEKNVVALVSGEVELPSDYHGVVYIHVGNSQWELKLAREMHAAGLDIDLNKLLTS